TLIDAALMAPRRSGRRRRAVTLWALTTGLTVLQPPVRLLGRVVGGLAPWRRRGEARAALPVWRTVSIWRERWVAPADTIRLLAGRVRELGAAARAGNACDRWDLEVRAGVGGVSRLLVLVEVHGRGRQLVRVRCTP